MTNNPSNPPRLFSGVFIPLLAAVLICTLVGSFTTWPYALAFGMGGTFAALLAIIVHIWANEQDGNRKTAKELAEEFNQRHYNPAVEAPKAVTGGQRPPWKQARLWLSTSSENGIIVYWLNVKPSTGPTCAIALNVHARSRIIYQSVITALNEQMNEAKRLGQALAWRYDM